jgi:hypothetical protein
MDGLKGHPTRVCLPIVVRLRLRETSQMLKLRMLPRREPIGVLV